MTTTLLSAQGMPRPPYGSFAGKPVAIIHPLPSNLTQLDQGIPYKLTGTYLGPTLGNVDTVVATARFINAAGIYQLAAGDSVILISATGGGVTIILPDVVAWMREPHYHPYNAFGRLIWIKDLAGNAGTFHITVNSFGTQLIDQSFAASINQNFGILRLTPLNSLTGWFVA